MITTIEDFQPYAVVLNKFKVLTPDQLENRLTAAATTAQDNYELAEYYRKGKDRNMAKQYYRNAADKGHAEAAYVLARIYYEPTTEYTNAAKYYKIAADRGHENAKIDLAMLLEKGKDGVAQDKAEAERLYKDLIVNGSTASLKARSQRWLDQLIKNGGTRKNKVSKTKYRKCNRRIVKSKSKSNRRNKNKRTNKRR